MRHAIRATAGISQPHATTSRTLATSPNHCHAPPAFLPTLSTLLCSCRYASCHCRPILRRSRRSPGLLDHPECAKAKPRFLRHTVEGHRHRPRFADGRRQTVSPSSTPLDRFHFSPSFYRCPPFFDSPSEYAAAAAESAARLIFPPPRRSHALDKSSDRTKLAYANQRSSLLPLVGLAHQPPPSRHKGKRKVYFYSLIQAQCPHT